VKREPIWTESLAAGSAGLVERIKGQEPRELGP